MPLLKSEQHYGFTCKFYDGGIVKVGSSAAARFTFKPKPDQGFDKQLLSELVRQKALGREFELPSAAREYAAATGQPRPAEKSTAEQPPAEQSPAEPLDSSVLLGGSRQAEPLPDSIALKLRRLESDLGSVWEIGRSFPQAEAEREKLSREAHQEYQRKLDAARESRKRNREAREAESEPCLCTPGGAAVLLRESQEQTRQALKLVEQQQAKLTAWLRQGPAKAAAAAAATATAGSAAATATAGSAAATATAGSAVAESMAAGSTTAGPAAAVTACSATAVAAATAG